jgi:hypothetical protein
LSTANTRHTESTLVATSYSPPPNKPSPLLKETAPVSNIPPVVYADRQPLPAASAVQDVPPKPLAPAAVASALPVSDLSLKPAGRNEMSVGGAREATIPELAVKQTAFEDGVAGSGRYGHAPDYTWVRGEVRHTRKGWHLRYASLDEIDAHGGSVTLADDPRLCDLKEGDIVQVKGRLQNPSSRTGSPLYDVSDIHPVGQ